MDQPDRGQPHRYSFERLVQEYADRIFNVALRITGDRHDAEDATQEAFLNAFRAWSGFRGESSPTTWLYRIAVNTALMRVCARPPLTYVSTLSDEPDDRDWSARLADVDRRVDLQQKLLDGLGALEPDLRAALVRTGVMVDPNAPAATPPRHGAAAVLDESVLEPLRGLPGRSGPALIPELVAMFQREEPVRLAECERLFAERRSEALAEVAHKLAGSCANLGANEMRAAVLALEKAAHASAWEEVPRLLGELHLASRRLNDALSDRKLASA